MRHVNGNTPTQIKDELDAGYGDSAPSFVTVKFWAAEFKRSRTNLGDDERLGWPKTATTDDNIAQVHQMVLDNRRIKVREIAEAVNMSKERVSHILNQDLDETWIHHYTPETKTQSKQWTAKGELAPKKAKACFFGWESDGDWDSHGLKVALGGQRFSSNEEAITFVNNYFVEKDAKYYLDGLKRWEHRWEKCIDLQGDYVEK
ncbi:PREDICTED: uncharacterized protein LOC108758551 [Trachymyrmex cornetzi]|uniref:uncharacterized protein LOC108758551 n=1 Tax=Trachymyrmex cornetzi TaxID=471704 RepID=UPI00084EDE3A|nr:PREDICTED: uncharacterized protein LOC108758551 [Trachymyrmex cornetzi]